jgi:hypothetical protein
LNWLSLSLVCMCPFSSLPIIQGFVLFMASQMLVCSIHIFLGFFS